ncbi:DUF1697 domain-containing protein [Sphingomonas oryzagri]
MTRLIALIRGINVGSTRKLPMADLRTACAEEGLGEVKTYIQSGNVVFDEGSATEIETALARLIHTRFKLDVPVVVRTAAAWDELIAACPFPEEAKAAPRALHLVACQKVPAKDAVEALRGRAKHGEKIAAWGAHDIAIHFGGGVAESKLAPSLIDRLIGSPATGRNWNTMLKLQAMAAG